MDTIQIEVTNACHLSCSNCTRLCPHIRKPFMVDMDHFKLSIDSMKGYPKMVGIMGGEPLLHPHFEELCDYALSQIPRAQLGLWSSLPPGKEHYRDVIVRTFGNVFFNDHTIEVRHCPILVGAEEVIPDPADMWQAIDKCWLQECWSASVNPKGAFFCEIAASMSMLFDDPDHGGWPIEPGWWKRIPKDYRDQMEKWCPRCGCALSLSRRKSTDHVDDISPLNLSRLNGNSRRVSAGEYQLHDCKQLDKPEEMFQYKNPVFRDKVAYRYGIYTSATPLQFLEPHLMTTFIKGQEKKSMFELIKEKYGA
jgi:hypothetical protein